MNSNLIRRPVINVFSPKTPEEKKDFSQSIRRICGYLTHRDLSALSCVCKAFYEVLTTFENEIWRVSRIKFNLAKGLPPPKDLLEREYAKLFNYSKGCQNCKSYKHLRIYWLPRIRSCPNCIKINAISYRDFAELNWWGFPECIFNVAPIISYEFDFKDGMDYYWLPQVYSLAQEYRNLNLSMQGEDVLNNWLSTKRKKKAELLEDAFFRHKQLMNTEFSILFRTSFEPGEWIKMIESGINDGSKQRIGINEATRTSEDQNNVDKAVIPSFAQGGESLLSSTNSMNNTSKRKKKRSRAEKRLERRARLLREIEEEEEIRKDCHGLSRDKRTKYNLRRYIIKPKEPIPPKKKSASSNEKMVHRSPNLTEQKFSFSSFFQRNFFS